MPTASVPQAFTDSLTIELRVNPCTVQTFEATSSPIGTIIYELGQAQRVIGPYEFTATPDCGYSQSITVQNLPTSYVTHDTVAQDFTIASTLDPSFISTYNIQIRSTF